MALEPLAFEIGLVSTVTARILAAGTALYAIGTGYWSLRALASRHPDRWSSFGAAVVLALLAVLLALHGPTLLPAPFSVFVLAVYVGAIILALTYTLGRYEEKINHFKEEFGGRLNTVLADALPHEARDILEKMQARWREDREGRRKLPHLLMGLFLAAYAALGYLVVKGVWIAAYGGPGGGEGAHNLFVASHSGWLVAGHLLGVSCLLALLFMLAPNEMLRLSYPELGYPFKATILDRMRAKEEGLFGAHYYIAAALPLAALWLTRQPTSWDIGIMAVMAMVAVTVFADSASALFGIRYGRRKWFHNPDKSYIGSAAGTVVAFLVALPFVGVPMAGVAAGVFLFVDIIGPVPVAVTDNILNPVALALAFTFLWPWIDPLLPFY